MTKQELLSIAGQCRSASETAMDLAGRLSSAESVTTLTHEAQQDCDRNVRTEKLWDPVPTVSSISFVVASMYFVVAQPPDMDKSAIPYWPIWTLVALVAVLLLGCYKAGGAQERRRARQFELEALAPIATDVARFGRSLCEEALEYVATARPEVLAWRDIAIAERDQLYAFDVEIMRCIHEKMTEDEKVAANALLNEQAFELVHSIGRPGAAGTPVVA